MPLSVIICWEIKTGVSSGLKYQLFTFIFWQSRELLEKLDWTYSQSQDSYFSTPPRVWCWDLNKGKVRSTSASPRTQTVKNLFAMPETRVQSLGREDPLETGMTTHSCIPAWEIPWTRVTKGDSLWVTGSQGHKELDTTDWLTLSLFGSMKQTVTPACQLDLT